MLIRLVSGEKENDIRYDFADIIAAEIGVGGRIDNSAVVNEMMEKTLNLAINFITQSENFILDQLNGWDLRASWRKCRTGESITTLKLPSTLGPPSRRGAGRVSGFQKNVKNRLGPRRRWCTHSILLGKTTRCEKGLREIHNRTPRDAAQELHNASGWSASKMSTGFCSPGNAGRDGGGGVGGQQRDRSENADYQYASALRQIDGRIRFLTKRIEAAEV